MIERLEKMIATSRLFFATSITSRSAAAFARGDVILPSLTMYTFVQALESLQVQTHFIPSGEADGLCVALADELGAFIFSRDSDFYILMSTAKGRLRGYCPMDMMFWIEGDERDDLAGSRDGFTPVHRRGGRAPPTLLPPASLRRPALVMTITSPSALQNRLHLPPSLLPALGALCGNDYTQDVGSYFFEPSMRATTKIEKVAHVLRQEAAAARPRSAQSTPTSDAGDHAVDLVRRVVQKLAIRPFHSETHLNGVVDMLIEAMFQYILPSSIRCCELYPFCGGLEEQCRFSRLDESEGASVPPPVVRAFASAQRRGRAGNVTHVYLFPERFYLYSVLEDPHDPSAKSCSLAIDLRRRAYSIANQALGGFRWSKPVATQVHNDAEAHTDLEIEEATLAEVLAAREDPHSPKSIGGMILGDSAHSSNGQGDTADSVSLSLEPKQEVIEYLRTGSSDRYSPSAVPLPPIDLGEPIISIAPIHERLQAYLSAMQSTNPLTTDLPSHLHPLVGGIRMSILCASSRNVSRWRQHEVEAVVRACIGTLAAWDRETKGKLPFLSDEPGSWPPLNNRNTQIVGQMSSTLVDAIVLAQALLLFPEEDLANLTTAQTDAKTNDTRHLTHLTPSMFFSGVHLHHLLNGEEPRVASWSWSPREQQTYDQCLAAVTEGLGEHVVPSRREAPAPHPTKRASDFATGPRTMSQHSQANGQMGRGKYVPAAFRSGRGGRGGVDVVGRGRFDALRNAPA